MKIIAGIDIKSEKCVHLTQGDTETSKVLCDRPVDLVQLLSERNIDAFHIVDIDGVFSGQTHLIDLLKEIRSATTLPIHFGGGIRNFETAKAILDIGIECIVIGTSAIQDEEMLIALVEKYGDRIIVAADVYKGYVYVEGWEENSETSLEEFLNTLHLLNVKTVMITDISKDGTLSGIDEYFIDDIAQNTPLSLIISGGIKSDKELMMMKDKNIDGVVISTAIYEGKITI